MIPAVPPPIRPLIVGNWKMNGVGESLAEARAVAEVLRQSPAVARVALCPPATLIHRMAETLTGTRVEVGAQDLHAEAAGAFTGDVCAAMLFDAGARLVIVGHSERRTLHREDDAHVAAKVQAAVRAAWSPSSASARPGRSARPATPRRWSRASFAVRCRRRWPRSPSLWPTSPSGPSAPG